VSRIDPDLVGVWKLLSLKRFRDGKFYRNPMGEAATGRIIYAKEGRMAAFLMSADWVAGRAQPRWDHFLSYSGRWFVKDGNVHHVLDAASISELIGTELVRRISWTEAGELTLITEGHVAADGHRSSDTLIWQRVNED